MLVFTSGTLWFRLEILMSSPAGVKSSSQSSEMSSRGTAQRPDETSRRGSGKDTEANLHLLDHGDGDNGDERSLLLALMLLVTGKFPDTQDPACGHRQEQAQI